MISILTNNLASGIGRAIDRGQLRLEQSAQRLSSGLRINSARDDAAGSAIVGRLTALRRGLEVDQRNINDLISAVQVADGALGSISENLQRIRELAIQAANATNRQAERQALQLEANQLMSASRRIQAMTEFNSRLLLDGSFAVDGYRPGGGTLPTFTISQLFLTQTTDVLLRYAQLSQATTTTTAGGALGAGDLVINGKSVPATAAGAEPGQSAGSAWALASAINQAGIKDLTATADATTLSGDPVAVLPNGGNVLAGDIVINGVPAGAGNIVTAINAISGQTGVRASLQAGNVLQLTASDGRDIDVAGAGGFGLNDSFKSGSVTIVGPLAEGGNLVISGTNPGAAGLAVGTIDGVDVGEPIPVSLTEDDGFDFNPNMLKEDDAQATIGAMDRKLDKLLGIRARLGAILNMLDTRKDTLAGMRDIAATSISRIADADYAQEVAALTKQKVLQEAALAMSAQANASFRQVLMLLIESLREQNRSR